MFWLEGKYTSGSVKLPVLNRLLLSNNNTSYVTCCQMILGLHIWPVHQLSRPISFSQTSWPWTVRKWIFHALSQTIKKILEEMEDTGIYMVRLMSPKVLTAFMLFSWVHGLPRRHHSFWSATLSIKAKSAIWWALFVG